MTEVSLFRVRDLLRRAPKSRLVPSSEYQRGGSLPIVDQGDGLVGGYTDRNEDRFPADTPVVVFGDHTCRLKYIDFPFARGAQGTQVLLPVEGLSPRFLYYALHTIDVSQFGYQRHFKYLQDARIPVPALQTQARIAAALGAFDDLIENNRRRIESLEEMARLIYREWFVHFRFPGHEDVELVDSDLGPIPEGWEAVPLSELVTTQYGYTESAQVEPVGPRYLRGMDMNKTSFIDWSAVPYCPISERDRQKFKVDVGDVFVIRMADPGKIGICEREVDAVFASYLVRLKPTDSRLLLPYYLFFTLNDDRYQGWVTGASTGATRKSVSAKVMTEPPVVLPPQHVQIKFVDTVASIRGLLTILLEQNSVLTEARDLLLPRLISGELDVSDLDVDLEPVA